MVNMLISKGNYIKMDIKRRKRKRLIIFAASLAAILFFVAAGLNNGLTAADYSLQSNKVDAPIRIALLTDLHSCFFGEGQEELIARIEEKGPDLILMAGDIADDSMPHDGTVRLLEAIGSRYDCFYVTGNHEIWSGEAAEIKDMFREYGVTVLEGDGVTVEVGGTALNICGVDDPDIGRTEFAEQLEAVAQAVDEEVFTVLVSHRPELIDMYAQYGFDLVVSGHAHGGQWRIPFLIKGVYAPNQGYFPDYTSGLYRSGETQMLVSRGLSRESTGIPRFYNPPEVVLLTLLPEID